MFSAVIINPKQNKNVGMVNRNVFMFGGTHLLKYGDPVYKGQSGDTAKSWRTLPTIDMTGKTPAEFHAFLKEHDTEMVAVETLDRLQDVDAYFACHHFEPYAKAVYVFGNESKGLDDEWLKEADFCLHIPQKRNGCLNVAVASGIILANHVAMV